MRICLPPVLANRQEKVLLILAVVIVLGVLFFKLQLLESCERLGQLGPEGKCHLSQDLVTLIAKLSTGGENLISSNVSAYYRSLTLLITCHILLIQVKECL